MRDIPFIRTFSNLSINLRGFLGLKSHSKVFQNHICSSKGSIRLRCHIANRTPPPSHHTNPPVQQIFQLSMKLFLVSVWLYTYKEKNAKVKTRKKENKINLLRFVLLGVCPQKVKIKQKEGKHRGKTHFRNAS